MALSCSPAPTPERWHASLLPPMADLDHSKVHGSGQGFQQETGLDDSAGLHDCSGGSLGRGVQEGLDSQHHPPPHKAVQQVTTPAWEKNGLFVDITEDANGCPSNLLAPTRTCVADVMILVWTNPLELLAWLREYVVEVLRADIEGKPSTCDVIKFTLSGLDVPLRIEIEVVRNGPVGIVFMKHVSRSDSVRFHGVCRNAVKCLSSQGWQMSVPDWLRAPAFELLPFDDEEEEL